MSTIAVWRGLMRDLRFRRALSLAVNRHEINEVIYFGLAIEGQNTVLPQSPLYEPAYRQAWAQYDLGEANRLLDLIGLTKRGSDDVRLLPDGRPMEIIVEYSGELPEEPDVLELIRNSWRHIGIRLFAKPAQLTLFRRRVFSGEALMSLDKGIENGLANAASSPWEFAPTTQQELEWPKWGQYYETKGRAGEPPDLPSAVRLRDLFNQWLGTASEEQAGADLARNPANLGRRSVFDRHGRRRIAACRRQRSTTQCPEKGIYNWDPGAFFGIYKPDHFWFETERRAKSAAAGNDPLAARYDAHKRRPRELVYRRHSHPRSVLGRLRLLPACDLDREAIDRVGDRHTATASPAPTGPAQC